MLLLIMIICLLTTIFGKYISTQIFMSINRNMHEKVIKSLINTKMQFFDENTSGRIINRLSRDMKTVDNIVFNFLEMIDYNIKCSFSVIFILFSNPVLILVVFAQLYYFRVLRQRVLHITRDCFRLK